MGNVSFLSSQMSYFLCFRAKDSTQVDNIERSLKLHYMEISLPIKILTVSRPTCIQVEVQAILLIMAFTASY